MAEELKNIQNDAAKLSDADMSNVAGGFTESDAGLGSWNQLIRCPKCGMTEKSKFKVTRNDMALGTEYRCEVCGCQIKVDKDGLIYDWTGYRK